MSRKKHRRLHLVISYTNGIVRQYGQANLQMAEATMYAGTDLPDYQQVANFLLLVKVDDHTDPGRYQVVAFHERIKTAPDIQIDMQIHKEFKHQSDRKRILSHLKPQTNE